MIYLILCLFIAYFLILPLLNTQYSYNNADQQKYYLYVFGAYAVFCIAIYFFILMPMFELPSIDMSQVTGIGGSMASSTTALYAGISFIVGSQVFKTRAPVKEENLAEQVATLLRTETQSNQLI